MKQADAITRLVHDVLGADVVAVYLYGSAVLGGLRPHSDLDLFAVARRPMTDGQRKALIDRLLENSRYPAQGDMRPVELTVVVQDAVRPWRYPPEREFQYGEWLRDEFEHGQAPPPGPDPDLAALITMVLLDGRALSGPPPREVLAAVPRDDLMRGMTATLPDLLAELETDTRNVVLTLARIWSTAATDRPPGELHSTVRILAKDAAAEWALERLPEEHRPVLARARSGYLGQADDHWDDLRPRLRPYAQYVTELIETAVRA